MVSANDLAADPFFPYLSRTLTYVQSFVAVFGLVAATYGE